MFQLTLHPEHEDKFEEYYAKCLRLFREDVCDTKAAMKDATLIAGILLCSTGVCWHSTPLRIHLVDIF